MATEVTISDVGADYASWAAFKADLNSASVLLPIDGAEEFTDDIHVTVLAKDDSTLVYSESMDFTQATDTTEAYHLKVIGDEGDVAGGSQIQFASGALYALDLADRVQIGNLIFENLDLYSASNSGVYARPRAVDEWIGFEIKECRLQGIIGLYLYDSYSNSYVHDSRIIGTTSYAIYFRLGNYHRGHNNLIICKAAVGNAAINSAGGTNVDLGHCTIISQNDSPIDGDGDVSHIHDSILYGVKTYYHSRSDIIRVKSRILVGFRNNCQYATGFPTKFFENQTAAEALEGLYQDWVFEDCLLATDPLFVDPSGDDWDDFVLQDISPIKKLLRTGLPNPGFTGQTHEIITPGIYQPSYTNKDYVLRAADGGVTDGDWYKANKTYVLDDDHDFGTGGTSEEAALDLSAPSVPTNFTITASANGRAWVIAATGDPGSTIILRTAGGVDIAAIDADVGSNTVTNLTAGTAYTPYAVQDGKADSAAGTAATAPTLAAALTLGGGELAYLRKGTATSAYFSYRPHPSFVSGVVIAEMRDGTRVQQDISSSGTFELTGLADGHYRIWVMAYNADDSDGALSNAIEYDHHLLSEEAIFDIEFRTDRNTTWTGGQYQTDTARERIVLNARCHHMQWQLKSAAQNKRIVQRSLHFEIRMLGKAMEASQT